MPPRRRRRKAKAVAVEVERGFAMRILMHSPKDVIAGGLAFAAVSAIITNALFLQAGRHPAPMFGSSVAVPAVLPANHLPRSRPPVDTDGALFESRPIEIKPVEAKASESKASESKASETKASETKASDFKPSDSKPSETKTVEFKAVEPKSADPISNLVKATAAAPMPPSNVVRPPAPIPPPHGDAVQITGSRRVAAVQRVLTEYGYGQLKATGTIGSDTQAAIHKFEREHKMQPTGQMSDRLVRELAGMVGHPID